MSGRPDEGRSPLFVERSTYRRRRYADAARALPVLGLFLLALPMLWRQASLPTSTSQALIYLFLCWAGLIFLAFLLAVLIGRSERDADARADGDPR